MGGNFNWGKLINKLKEEGLISRTVWRDLVQKSRLGALDKKTQKALKDLEILVGGVPEKLVPVCRKCDVDMSIKLTRDGLRAFWGCPNYFSNKKCRSTQNVDFLAIKKYKRRNEPDFPQDTRDKLVKKQVKRRQRHGRFAKVIRGGVDLE